MPSWNDLIQELDRLPNDKAKNEKLRTRLIENLQKVSELREGRNTIFYASAFLQKPLLPSPSIQLTFEEINGFMSVMEGMDWTKNLTLILHTPGGVTNAAETIVSYLHSKFEHIESIVPTFAMSAGTMICLGTERIVMGRQSQLGPIDPQMPIGGRTVSARAVVDQFEKAKEELSNDRQLAHVWAPILQSLGPSLLQEAENALDYGETMVRKWLENRMFIEQKDGPQKAAKIAKHFNKALSHGRRIDLKETQDQGVETEMLEDSQPLQEAVLTAYHLVTILFEKSPASKLLITNHGKMWVKNISPKAGIMPIPVPFGPRPIRR